MQNSSTKIVSAFGAFMLIAEGAAAPAFAQNCGLSVPARLMSQLTGCTETPPAPPTYTPEENIRANEEQLKKAAPAVLPDDHPLAKSGAMQRESMKRDIPAIIPDNPRFD